MGSVNKIECENCSFSVTTSDNLTMIVCEKNLDYFNELYCLNCQKVVKVLQRKNGKDMENRCPECGSRDVYLSLPDEINIKCPSCKKGNLKSELYFTDRLTSFLKILSYQERSFDLAFCSIFENSDSAFSK